MAARLDGPRGVRAEVAARALDVQVRVLKGRVRQAVAELEARLDVVVVEASVVDQDALGEVVLREVLVDALRQGGAGHVAVVRGVMGNGVWQSSGEVLLAVEKRDQGFAGRLAGHVSIHNSGDVFHVYPGVDEAGPGVVDDDDGVAALHGDVLHQGVGILIHQADTVVAFAGPRAGSGLISFDDFPELASIFLGEIRNQLT